MVYLCRYTMQCNSRKWCGKCLFSPTLNSTKQDHCKYATRLNKRDEEHLIKCDICADRFKCWTEDKPLIAPDKRREDYTVTEASEWRM